MNNTNGNERVVVGYPIEASKTYEYTEFSPKDRGTVVANAERIRDWAEQVARYIDSEALFDEDVLQDFRQDSGDIGDLVFEINMIMNKWIYGGK